MARPKAANGEVSTIESVVNETLDAIKKGQRQLYDITENTRVEYNRVKEELDRIRSEVAEIIEQADALKVKEYKARVHLAEVSKDFKRYTEEDIKKAYESAQQAQFKLFEIRNREKLLRYRRDYLEVSLRRLSGTFEKAEQMVNHMGTVLRFLTNELDLLGSKLDELQQVQQMGLHIIRAQEEERRRVAREIHDGPAQVMANIAMRAEFILKLIDVEPEKVREELCGLQNLVKQSLQDVRKIIFDLRPMVLDDLGLIPALQRYSADYHSQYGISVEFSVTGQSNRFSNAIEVALFRLVQEALTNVRKHARATEVFVKMDISADRVVLTIKDNGRGFNVKQTMADRKRGGYGLLGMKERVQLLKGDLKIDSVLGEGTVIRIEVPVQQVREEET